MINPLILLNSLTLWVTSTALAQRAVPAIKLSRGPMGLPCFSNSALTEAETSASPEAKGTTVIRETSDSNCFFRLEGLFDLAMPTSISYRTIAGTAISFGDLKWFLVPVPLVRHRSDYRIYQSGIQLEITRSPVLKNATRRPSLPPGSIPGLFVG